MELLRELLRFFWREISVFLLAAVPGVEMRVALPLGVAAGMNPYEALIISYLGSMFPAWPILLWIKPLLRRLRRHRFFRNKVDWLVRRTVRKSDTIRKYSIYGLALFVAVPLPMTGVWTGAMIAAFLDLPSLKSFAALAAGNAAAGVLLTFFSAQVF